MRGTWIILSPSLLITPLYMTTLSTHAAEFERTATSRPAVHQPRRRDSFNQQGTTVSLAQLEQIDRPHFPAILGDVPGTQSSLARRSHRKHIHIAIMFLICTSGGYIEVAYQSREKSPFDDPDKDPIMVTILVSLCLYVVCFIAEYAAPSEEHQLHHIIIKTLGPLFGFLVPVLILMILVPWVGIVASIIWGLFVLKAAITLYAVVVQFLRKVLSGMTSWFSSAASHCLELPSMNPSVQSEGDLNAVL